MVDTLVDPFNQDEGNLLVCLSRNSTEQVLHDVGHVLHKDAGVAHTLLHSLFDAADQFWHEGRTGSPDILVEDELQQWNHNLGSGIGVLVHPRLELSVVADKHVACSGLLFQGSSAQGHLLVSNNNSRQALTSLGIFVVRSGEHFVRLEASRGQQWRHDELQVGNKLLAQALRDASPSLQQVGNLRVVGVHLRRLCLHHSFHDLLRIPSELLRADSHTNQGDALHSLAAQHTISLEIAGRENLLQERHDHVVVADEMLFGAVSHRCNGRDHLLLHQPPASPKHHGQLADQ
mmetsp:Transcript_7590/g.17419  ORF Transcript_7590/g.17419 Transcript_7590/m.17419 type:complete len:290 (-) Transcript_7590:1472-2341(-)